MGSGWRRSFCNTASAGRKEAASDYDSSTTKTGIDISPRLERKTTPKSHSKSPRIVSASNPSSPRSPFSIFKNTLRLSRNSCGVCMQSVKRGHGTAIYTAECSHAFHFPCIASHVRKQDALSCPVCLTVWKDVPLLHIHKPNQIQEQEEANSSTPTKQTPISSSKFTQQVSSKSYADDDPLASPKFDQIPKETRETEAAEFKEVEESQGFFNNPISSSDSSFTSKRDYSRNVEVCLSPEAAVISTGPTHETYAVVLKIKAPPPSPPQATTFPQASRRAPIDLVTVLDISGSMGGAKLQMLKRAMHLVISSLGPADRLSVVTFSITPKRLIPLTRMTAQAQRSARQIVDRLSCRHGSSIYEALKLATKVLQDRREINPVATIMLLSDGQDAIIPTEDEATQRQVSSTRFAHIQLPVNRSHKSTGLRHDQAEEAFSKCVGGLLSVVVQDLKIQLGLATGSDPVEILAIYPGKGQYPTVLDLNSIIKLGNLYAEEERELYVQLRVPNSNVGSAGHRVLSVATSHKDPSTQAVVYGGDHFLLVPKPRGLRSRLVEHLRFSFISTRALAESRRLIEYNEVRSAVEFLSSTRALLLQSRSELALESLRVLEAELAEVQRRRKAAEDVKMLVYG